MIQLILASALTNHFAAGFGVAAAILILGGIVLLRFQRNRQEFALMRAALEKGVSAFPNAQPPWLISLRQGVLTLALGVGLIGVGVVLWAISRNVEPPPVTPVLSMDTADAPTTAPARRPKPDPKPYNPAKERWDQAKSRQTVALWLMGSGGVLVLLGCVRTAFARVEKKVTAEVSP